MLQMKPKQLFNTVKHLKQQIKQKENNTIGKMWLESCWMIFWAYEYVSNIHTNFSVCLIL